MKNQSIFLINSTHKTKTWWMFLSVLLFVFVPFLIILLLCGEFNLLGNDWLIAKNSSVWHGIVSSQNYDWLLNNFFKYVSGGKEALGPMLNEWMDKSASINSSYTFFNPIILAPLLGLLVWAIIYPIIFNAFKISGLDILPFSIAVAMFMLSLIFSGLIDQWGQNLLAVYWLVRIFIAAIITFVFFIITNVIVNRYLSSRPYATDIYFGYKVIDSTNANTKQHLKENVEAFKKQNDDEKTFIEVEEGK